MSKAKLKDREEKRRRDRWGYFAWGVLAFLILFHTMNNLIVLRQDTTLLASDGLHHYKMTVQILRGSSGENAWERIKSLYMASTGTLHPPLFGIVSGVFMLLFGISQDVALMANIPFLAVLLISTYFIGKELFNQETGLIAVILLSFFPGTFSFSRAYRVDFALAALVALSVLCLIRTRHMTSQRGSLLFGAVLGLAALSKNTFVLFLPGPVIVLVVVPLVRRIAAREFGQVKKIILNFALVGLLTFLIAGPWYVLQAEEFHQRVLDDVVGSGGLLHPDPDEEFISEMVLAHPGWLLKSYLLFPLAVLFAFALIYHLIGFRKHRALLLTWMVIPYLYHAIMGPILASEMIRYLLPVVPATALILALFLERLMNLITKAHREYSLRCAYFCILLLMIETPLFLVITYGGNGNLIEPFGKSPESTSFGYPWWGDWGLTSPFSMGWELEEVTDLIADDWSDKDMLPSVFVLDWTDWISEGILTELELQLAPQSTENELSVSIGRHCSEADSRMGSIGQSAYQDCIRAFDTSDYAIVKEIYLFESGVLGEQDYYNVLVPLSNHIRETLTNYTVLAVLPVPELVRPADYQGVVDPAFDWLNKSVWILRKNDM